MGFAERDRRRAREIDSLELPVREESEETAVGGPEGIGIPSRTGNRARREIFEIPEPKAGSSVGTCRLESDMPAVRRNGQGPGARAGKLEFRLLRWKQKRSHAERLGRPAAK